MTSSFMNSSHAFSIVMTFDLIVIHNNLIIKH